MMLVDLAELGLTDRQLAERLGRSVRALQMKMAALRKQGVRFTRPHVTEAAMKGERAYAMRVEGLQWREISKRLGLRAYGAHSYAQKYAARERKPWPVKA